MQDVEAAVAEDFARIRETQIAFVLRLLERSLSRLKMALILPRLAENIEDVSQTLQNTEYEPAIQKLQKLKSLNAAKMQQVDSDVLQTIDYFLRNHPIANLFPRFLNNLSADNRKLVNAFETIMAVASRHLKRTSKTEIIMERQLHIMFKAEEHTKAKIIQYKRELKCRHIALRWKQASKSLTLDKLDTELASRKWKNNVHIQNEVEKRTQLQQHNHRHFLVKRKELEEELIMGRRDYEALTMRNANEEKEIRAEKNKLLIQLENTIRKHDTNIGEKLRESLELEDEYLVAKKELDEFMVYYRKEEAIYNKIVVQYEQEERRKQQERIMLFMMNRAARTIQTYWQKWRKDQKMKARKARKGQKKKK